MIYQPWKILNLAFIGKNELFIINYITYNIFFLYSEMGKNNYYWLFILIILYIIFNICIILYIYFFSFIQQVSSGVMVETEEYYVKYKN